jgi:prepilin-type N-terminal cleavage/methylation domain-containing protein
MSNCKAFTLIEMMTGLLILAILFLIAMPAGSHLVAENHTQTQVSQLISLIDYARTEAISRNENIILCKTSDYLSCNGDWRDGQMVQTKQNQLLRTATALPLGDRLIWNSSGGTDDYLELLPTGYTNGQRGTFYYCSANENHNYSREVVVMSTGRTYAAAMNAEDFAQYCLS